MAKRNTIQELQARFPKVIRAVKRYPNAFVLAGYLALTCLLFWTELSRVNTHLLGDQLDGTKNAYTLAACVDGDDWLQFKGMNYPFGMGYTYTDGHVPLGMLCKLFGLSGNTAVGLMFVLILLGPALFCFYAYRLFFSCKLPRLIALLAPIPIALLSPQLERMLGHYALSYAFLFPALFYLIYFKLKNRPSMVQVLLGILMVTLVFFVHPYLGVLMCFGLFAKVVFARSYAGDDSTFHPVYSRLLILIIPVLAIAAFQGVMSATAPVFERPLPFGFWEYQSNVDSYLYPKADFLRTWYSGQFGFRPLVSEGLCYLGLFILLGVVISAVRLVKEKQNSHYILLPILGCGLCGWILSIGLPFDLLPSLYDHSGPFQEFRTLGRFSWLLYYALAFAIVVILGNHKTGNKVPRHILLGLIALGSIEGGAYVSNLKSRFPEQPRFAEFDASLPENPPFSAAHFEAIFPYPFVYVGCDNFGTPKNTALSKACLKLSWITGVPTVTNASSRQPVHYPATLSTAYQRCGGSDALLQHFEGGDKAFALLFQSSELPVLAARFTDQQPLQIGEDFWIYEFTADDLRNGILAPSSQTAPEVLWQNEKMEVGVHRFEHITDLSDLPQGTYTLEFDYLAVSDEPLLKSILFESKSANDATWLQRQPITDAACWDGEFIHFQMAFQNDSTPPGMVKQLVLVNDTIYPREITLEHIVLRGS